MKGDRLLNTPKDFYFQNWGYNGNSDRDQLRDSYPATISVVAYSWGPGTEVKTREIARFQAPEKSIGEKVIPQGQLEPGAALESEENHAGKTATAAE